MQTNKISAIALIDSLPEQVTWDDIMYELYIKQKIEAGLEAVKQGKHIPHETAKRQFLDNAD